MVYGGCQRILHDGRQCKLERWARCGRRASDIFPKHNSWFCDDHLCVVIGEGVPMFNLIVEIGTLEVEVYKTVGIELLGMSNRQWAWAYGKIPIPRDVVSQIQWDLWTVRLVTKFLNGEVQYMKAIDFEVYCIEAHVVNFILDEVQEE